jgi:hypothetical protein
MNLKMAEHVAQQLGKIIGKGGFGTVHKGRNLNTGTRQRTEDKGPRWGL